MKNDYYGQFVLAREEFAREELIVLDRYNTFKLNTWIINVHKNLIVVNIYTIDNIHIGWIIGHVIDNKNELFIEDKVIFPFSSGMLVDKKGELIEEFLYQFGGRYVCVVLDNDLQRIYLDAAGSLSCVYSLRNQIIASSPGLILDKKLYYDDIDKELYKLLCMPRDGWYPSGLTPHTSIARLLPNHYLDLLSWKSVRHWPLSVVSSCSDPIMVTKDIINIIKPTIRTIANKFGIYLTLTAGRDSRMLLACSRRIIKKIKFVTFTESKETVDTYTARLLTSHFGLNAELIDIKIATEKQRSNWLYEVGHCVGGRILDIHQTLSQLDKERMILPGLGGEVGRAYYWKHSDKEKSNISSKILLQRLHLPSHIRLQAQTTKWLNEINYLSTSQILDLAYIEQRLGCWGGPQTYGQTQFLNHLYPLIHRSIFEKILSMPPEYKRNCYLYRDVLQLEWPDLLDIPVNQFKGVRNIMEKIKKIKSMPSKLLMNIKNI